MKQVIFVDDEQRVLDGLRRALRPLRDRWEMSFFCEAGEALTHAEELGCDVIVTDMRMPDMDGVELLDAVRAIRPAAVRIALSGQSDDEMIQRSVECAHQFLAKPCEADQLVSAIDRVCQLQELLSSCRLRTLVAGMTSVPTLPEPYQQIMNELRSEDASLKACGEIVERDIAMSAKILQLVNSAFFGLPQPAASVVQAASFLGIDTLKALVLGEGVFRQFSADTVELLDLEGLWNASLRRGNLAKAIALEVTEDKTTAELALTAGLISDIGVLVLASEFPQKTSSGQFLVEKDGPPQWQIENELFGANHMDVGAYLAALWGLPTPIVEAIAYHHRPMVGSEFGVLAAVHIADAVIQNEGKDVMDRVDQDYLASLDALDMPERWVRSLYEEETAHE